MIHRKCAILILLLLSDLPAVPQVEPSGSSPQQRKALHEAIKEKDAAQVRKLLAGGADVNAAYYGRIPLHEAVYRRDKAIIKLLLDSGADINRRDQNKTTALHMYVGHAREWLPEKDEAEEDVEIVRLLMARGASVESKNDRGNSPIETAMSHSRPDLVEVLLTGVKNITIHQAAYTGRWERIEFLLNNGADINQPDEKGRTALYHAACMANQLGIVKRLIARGADITLGWEDDTPLPGAVYLGHYDVAKVLIDSGADVNIQEHEGTTPLHIAINTYELGVKDIVEYLLTHGARVDIRDDAGDTALDAAIARERLLHDRSDIAALLLARIPNKTIHQAAYASDWERIELLLSGGADIDEPDKEGCTALCYAAWANQLHVARRLIAEGADVNSTNKDGLAILHYLASYQAKLEDYHPIRCEQPQEYREMVRFLLANGADVNIRGGYRKSTALHGAAGYGDVPMVNLLIAHGADVNAKDRHGSTPISYAISDHHNIAGLLLEKGASASIAGEDGLTPLHILVSRYRASAGKADKNLAALLISRGADIDARDKIGRTPLHCAADSGYSDMVRMLLSQGAEVNAKDERGLTPLDQAAQRGAVETYRILEASGARGQTKLRSNR